MQDNSLNKFHSNLKSFQIAGKTYHLKKFSLAAQVWINEEFATNNELNGLENFSNELKKPNLSVVSKVCYFLLEDKTDFPILESFINALGDTYTGLKILLSPLCTVITDAQPEQMSEEEVKLKKS